MITHIYQALTYYVQNSVVRALQVHSFNPHSNPNWQVL